MKINYQHFREYIFFYILILLIIVVGIISYNRFMVRHDYIVGYEGVCDPAMEQCFIGCDDDACTEEYYYSKIQKYAPDLYVECGEDITDCEAASVCLTNDRKCSITYCNIEIDGDVCKISVENIDNIQSNN